MSVTEFTYLGREMQTSPLPAGLQPAAAIQNVSFTTTAGASSAFGSETLFVRIVVDADARILFGSAPTATQTDMLLAAGQAEYFGTKPGDKVSAVEVV